MTINQAIRILDPDTSAEALGEIKYYGGLHGQEKMMAACEEACRMAVQIMRKYMVTEYHGFRCMNRQNKIFMVNPNSFLLAE